MSFKNDLLLATTALLDQQMHRGAAEQIVKCDRVAVFEEHTLREKKTHKKYSAHIVSLDIICHYLRRRKSFAWPAPYQFRLAAFA